MLQLQFEIRSVIIYGGRETPKNSGYKNNINLYENGLRCVGFTKRTEKNVKIIKSA